MGVHLTKAREDQLEELRHYVVKIQEGNAGFKLHNIDQLHFGTQPRNAKEFKNTLIGLIDLATALKSQIDLFVEKNTQEKEHELELRNLAHVIESLQMEVRQKDIQLEERAQTIRMLQAEIQEKNMLMGDRDVRTKTQQGAIQEKNIQLEDRARIIQELRKQLKDRDETKAWLQLEAQRKDVQLEERARAMRILQTEIQEKKLQLEDRVRIIQKLQQEIQKVDLQKTGLQGDLQHLQRKFNQVLVEKTETSNEVLRKMGFISSKSDVFVRHTFDSNFRKETFCGEHCVTELIQTLYGVEELFKTYRSSDFSGKQGCTEFGLKVLVTENIRRLHAQWDIRSEVELKIENGSSKYADLILQHKKENVVVILELKYVRLEYIQSLALLITCASPQKRNNRNGLEEAIKMINSIKNPMDLLDWKWITHIKSVKTVDGKFEKEKYESTIDSQLKLAEVQVSEYVSILSKTEQTKTIVPLVCMGVGPRILITYIPSDLKNDLLDPKNSTTCNCTKGCITKSCKCRKVRGSCSSFCTCINCKYPPLKK